jgi:hypothetical protein
MQAILNLTKEMTWCEFAGSEFGFVFFLISNLFFIRFSISNRYFALLVMQVGFTATSLMGIYNGFIV